MGQIVKLAEDISTLPTIETDGEWKPFWDGAKRGKLIIQKCPACGHRQFYPRNLCMECAATPEWEVATGKGTLYTYSVVQQHYLAPFKNMLPYVVVMVDLAEGVRMMGNLIDVDVDAIAIGMPLEVALVAVRDDLTVPYWRPAA